MNKRFHCPTGMLKSFQSSLVSYFIKKTFENNACLRLRMVLKDWLGVPGALMGILELLALALTGDAELYYYTSMPHMLFLFPVSTPIVLASSENFLVTFERMLPNFQCAAFAHTFELHRIAWTFLCWELCATQFERWGGKATTGEIKHELFLSYKDSRGAGKRKKKIKVPNTDEEMYVTVIMLNVQLSHVKCFSIGMVEGPQGFLSLCVGLLRASTLHVRLLASALRWHLIRAADLAASWRLQILAIWKHLYFRSNVSNDLGHGNSQKSYYHISMRCRTAYKLPA